MSGAYAMAYPIEPEPLNNSEHIEPRRSRDQERPNPGFRLEPPRQQQASGAEQDYFRNGKKWKDAEPEPLIYLRLVGRD